MHRLKSLLSVIAVIFLMAFAFSNSLFKLLVLDTGMVNPKNSVISRRLQAGRAWDEHYIDENTGVESTVKVFHCEKSTFLSMNEHEYKVFNNNVNYIYRNQYDKCVIDFYDGTGIVADCSQNGQYLEGEYGRLTGNYEIESALAGIVFRDDYILVKHDNEEYRISGSEKDFLFSGLNGGKGLSEIDELSEYLYSLTETDYWVFVSVKDDGFNKLTTGINDQMHDLGLTTDFMDKSLCRHSFAAIIHQGVVIHELVDNDQIHFEGMIDESGWSYSVKSAGYECGNNSSIVINNIEYSPDMRGLNIVVYDQYHDAVIDAVNFDTYSTLAASARH